MDISIYYDAFLGKPQRAKHIEFKLDEFTGALPKWTLEGRNT